MVLDWAFSAKLSAILTKHLHFISLDDENDSEDLKGLLEGWDIPELREQFSPNNPLMNDIIHILESESSNASQQDCLEKERHAANNNIYSSNTNHQPSQQTLQQNNNATQQHNNTTSPQQLPNRNMSSNQMIDMHHSQVSNYINVLCNSF